MALTKETRARHYLEASQKASYTGLPDEQRQAYESQMAGHERKYPGVLEHALSGADQDFDKPLAAGTREHQKHLRAEHGLQHADVLRLRRERRTGASPSPKRASGVRRRRSPALAGPRAARAAAGAGAGAIASTIPGHGTFMYFIGLTLGLSLIYLLVAGKGAGVLTGITNTLVGGVRAFVAPVDPIHAAEAALGATPITSSPPTGSPAAGNSAAGQAPAPGTTAPSYPVNKSFPLAPAPAVAGARGVGRPSAALLAQDLRLRASSRKLLGEHRITPKQAAKREEQLIPRAKYPSFYGGHA